MKQPNVESTITHSIHRACLDMICSCTLNIREALPQLSLVIGIRLRRRIPQQCWIHKVANVLLHFATFSLLLFALHTAHLKYKLIGGWNRLLKKPESTYRGCSGDEIIAVPKMTKLTVRRKNNDLRKCMWWNFTGYVARCSVLISCLSLSARSGHVTMISLAMCVVNR